MKFYLGTPPVEFVATAGVPVLASLNYLKPDTPAATAPWVLDSGGFAELGKHGRWRHSAPQHVERVRAAIEQIGPCDFAGQQDWTCGPSSIEASGLTVIEHQLRTVANYLELWELAPEVPWLPTLQGWTAEDYERHVQFFEDEGVKLGELPLVGIGSIANRQHDPEVGRIVRHVAAHGLRLHGFGVKKQGLLMYGDVLAAADSSTWTIAARYLPPAPGALPADDKATRSSAECEAEFQRGEHGATCARCLRFALRWRKELLAALADAHGEQDALFEPDDTYRGQAKAPRKTFKMPVAYEDNQTTMEVE